MMQQLQRLLHDEHLESLADGYDRAALLSATSATYVLHQDVSYDYTAPITDVRQRLMILPRRQHGDQVLLAQKFHVDRCTDQAVRRRGDRFGNSVVHVRAPRVERSMHFRARAVIRRQTAGAGHAPWTTSLSASTTALTRPDDALRDAIVALGVARQVRRDPFGVADAVSHFVRSSFTYAHDVTTVRTTAAEAWQGRAGVCQDMAHVVIAMCSTIGLPARYVSGHLVGDGASHAWVEVLDVARGRVLAIDPTHDRRTDLGYVTTAVGRDYRDVAPMAGTFVSATARGRLSVSKRIRLADLV